MYDVTEKLQPFLLIGLGAVLGSSLRFYITNYFRVAYSSSYLGTVIVNIVSAFSLGFFIAIQERFGGNSFNLESPLFLFLTVGCLGSLSTFSTFIADILKTILDKRWKLCFGLAFCSLLAGLLFALLGLAFGNV